MSPYWTVSNFSVTTVQWSTLLTAIINRIMAWKYCNRNFSRWHRGRRPHGPQTYVSICTYTCTKRHLHVRQRRVSVSPRENVEWNYVKRRYSTLCWREFTVLPSDPSTSSYSSSSSSSSSLRAARRLKGYKRTDPCVSPLFPLIFLLENPQSVRSGG